MKKPILKAQITLDTFFKSQAREFFGSCGYLVETEHEMLKNPKKLDVLLIKQNTASLGFDIFDYFTPFNLVSYKSYGDALRTQDIYDLSIYTNLYLRENPKANYGNTTITLICSRTPRKFIREYKEYFAETCPGHFIGDYGMYKIHIINIETIRLSGPDGMFLSEFCRNIDRLSDQAEIKGSGFPKQIVDKLRKGTIMRLSIFEGKEDNMVPVADVTELMRPQLEKAWDDGIEEGKKEGKEEGRNEEKTQTAKRLKVAGVSLDIIIKATGLSEKELKKL